jgi:hypothetical protein
MEALRETLRSRKVTRDQILQMARDLRVERVILPYMEMEAGAYISGNLCLRSSGRD